jgi:hypothetical protein
VLAISKNLATYGAKSDCNCFKSFWNFIPQYLLKSFLSIPSENPCHFVVNGLILKKLHMQTKTPRGKCMSSWIPKWLHSRLFNCTTMNQQ